MTTAGTILGHYALGPPLGSSGLATVYRATDTRSGQHVALKILHAYFAPEVELIQRYFQELERIRALPHPNILPPLEWGREQDTIWVTTEYVPEGSLRATWSAPASPEAVLVIVDGVVTALEHALAHGITHRDLKPNNIFWETEGDTVRLGDFGMAALGESAHPLVRTALTTPMPSFMAPEYISEGHADARSETFSLAVLTYWLLTGTVPYPSEAPSTMYTKAMRHQVTAPSAINPSVPTEVDKIILRTLAPFAQVRPDGPKAFAGVLHAAVLTGIRQVAVDTSVDTSTPELARETAPEPAPPSSASWVDPAALERLWRVPGPRNILRERLTHAALAVSFIVASVLSYAALNKPPIIPPTSTSISAAVAPTRWVLPRFDLRNSGYAPVSSRGIKGEVKWEFRTTAPLLAAPSSDGSTVYAATGDNRIVALDVETGATKWEVTTTGPIDASPVAAGDLVYVGLRDSRIRALDSATGQTRWEFRTGNPVVSPGVVADGVLYQGSGDGNLYALDAATGAMLWSFDTKGWVVSPPAVVDDLVIVAGRTGRIHFLERATGLERFIFNTRRPVPTAPAVADGLVYLAAENRGLLAVDIHERSTFMDQELYTIEAQLYIWMMVPKPDPPKGLVWLARLPGRMASSAAVAHGMVYVGAQGNQILAFDQDTGEMVWEFATMSPVLGSPVVTENALYAGGDDGTVYALDPRTGEALWTFQTGGRIRTNPVVTGGNTLLVASEDGVLYALQ